MKPKNPPPRASAGAARALDSELSFHRILVPIDFSPPSRRALAYAAKFARQNHAKLIVLHVFEPIATPDFTAAFPLVKEYDQLMRAAQRELEALIRKAGIPPEGIERALVRSGRAFREIATVARSLKADLIIISTRGYTGLKHILLGSTTERVVHDAPCPVLVLRPP